MKVLDKEVRAWDVYAGLESTVKNLLTSLRAVNELQNSAIRERHWQQLINTTGVKCMCWFLGDWRLPIINAITTTGWRVFVLILRSGLWWGRTPHWGTCWNYSFIEWRMRSKTLWTKLWKKWASRRYGTSMFLFFFSSFVVCFVCVVMFFIVFFTGFSRNNPDLECYGVIIWDPHEHRNSFAKSWWEFNWNSRGQPSESVHWICWQPTSNALFKK